MKRIYLNLIILALIGCGSLIQAGPGMKVAIMIYGMVLDPYIKENELAIKETLRETTGSNAIGDMLYKDKKKVVVTSPHEEIGFSFQRPTPTTMSKKIIPFGHGTQSSAKQPSMGRTLYGSGKGISMGGAGSKGAGSVGLAGILDKDEVKPGIVQRPMTGLEDMLRMDIQERKSGIVTRADVQARKLELARINAQQELAALLQMGSKQEKIQELNVLIAESEKALDLALESNDEEIATIAQNMLNGAKATLKSLD
jgi:hypothetical protein